MKSIASGLRLANRESNDSCTPMKCKTQTTHQHLQNTTNKNFNHKPEIIGDIFVTCRLKHHHKTNRKKTETNRKPIIIVATEQDTDHQLRFWNTHSSEKRIPGKYFNMSWQKITWMNSIKHKMHIHSKCHQIIHHLHESALHNTLIHRIPTSSFIFLHHIQSCCR